MSKHSLTEEQIKDKFEKACMAHQEGQNDLAEQLYKELLVLFPDAFILNYNLGLLCQEEEKFETALTYYKAALKDNSNDPDLLFNIGLCYKFLANIDKAIFSFSESLKLQPDSIDSMYNLGGCYRLKNDWAKAKEFYSQALRLNDEYQPALSNLAYTCHRLGETEEALQLYEKLIELNPEHKGAIHMVATLRGEELLNTDKDYVAELFDDYSDHFEDDLVFTLHYQVPALLKQELFSYIDPDTSFKNVLDLGCGTGLAGVEIHKNCTSLIGVDLSTKMIEKARDKNIYDQLYATDIIEFLQAEKTLYDLFIAADVFSYIGELDKTFEVIAKRSEINATLAFSIEKIEGSKDLELGATGRFKHSNRYIEKLCDTNGFEIVRATEANLRQEAGKWVEGYLYLLRKVD